MAEILLINPRFEVSYWGLEHAMAIFGKRANVPVACLPLLAALTPERHRVTLVDENVEAIDFDRVSGADIVGVTGMVVQRFRMREILEELKRRGLFTVVGGPWISVEEDYFGSLVDVSFIGEAEQTWPQFLDQWERGTHYTRYEQSNRTDMTTVPTPRFDLLKMKHYMFGSLQFSRGCPFQCEFCDIIVTFGRVPRLKNTAQVVAELEALRAQKSEIVFVVDDNLIGNRRVIKSLLLDVIRWQKTNGYPISFFTEASLDLAEDEELMRLMVEANFMSVFIGIESPNEDSLRETKKFQNVRQGGTLIEKVSRVQNAGLEVWCGMIVGFDHDDATIFAAQRKFIHDAQIGLAMIGMLAAIPKTPLHARLVDEGRLDPMDKTPFGTNVIPLLMSREELRDGYVALMEELYEPEAFFDRIEGLYLRDKFTFARARSRYWWRHPWQGVRAQFFNLARSAVIYRRLMRHVRDKSLQCEYRLRITRLLKSRRDPAVLFVYSIKCAVHFHHYTMTNQMASKESPVRNTF
jgi:radical SAM superfamily enzyme YgiQ (UPF0313 family)